MRLLIVIHQFLPEFNSGTERFAYNLAKSAQRAGNHVEILTCAIDESRWDGSANSSLLRACVDGIPVTAVRRRLLGRRADFDLISPPAPGREAFEEFFSERQFDVCHIVHPMRMYGALEWIARKRLPYIVSVTDFYFLCYRVNLINAAGSVCCGPKGGQACVSSCSVHELAAAQLSKRYAAAATALTNARAVIACSQLVADAFRREFRDLPIKTQAHGVDVSLWRRSQGTPADAKLKDRVTFGYIGTLSEEKGVRTLVDGFSQVGAANARLRLVGSPSGSEELQDYLQGVTRVDPRISIGDVVPFEAVPDVLSSFDVLCVPSLVPETFSFTLHEALAIGLPALVSDIGNLGVVVGEKQCGAVVRPGCQQSWTRVLGGVVERPGLLAEWRSKIPLTVRIEEEAFFYETCYSAALAGRALSDLGSQP